MLALGSIAALACTTDLDGGTREVIFVRQALAPPLASDGACIYMANADAASMFEGTVDMGIRGDYQLTLLLQSSDPGIGTSVNSAHVVLRMGEEVLGEQDVIANAFVPGGGFGVVSFVAIDAPTVAKLAEKQEIERVTKGWPEGSVTTTVVIETQLTGRDPAGGGAASSAVFRFPVRACKGCLVSFENATDFAGPFQPNCQLPLHPDARRPCKAGQDEVTPCQLCLDRSVCNPSTR